MELDVRPAKAGEEAFAWRLYWPYIKKNIFDSKKFGVKPSDWIAKDERGRFAEYWASGGDRYVIELDGEVVGWCGTQRHPRRIVVENLFIKSDYQKKGVGERIMNEMVPRWKKDKLTIEVPVLKGTKFADGVERVLVRLGFAEDKSDDMTKTFKLN